MTFPNGITVALNSRVFAPFCDPLSFLSWLGYFTAGENKHKYGRERERSVSFGSNFYIYLPYSIDAERRIYTEIVIGFIWITNGNHVETWLRMSFPKIGFYAKQLIEKRSTEFADCSFNCCLNGSLYLCLCLCMHPYERMRLMNRFASLNIWSIRLTIKCIYAPNIHLHSSMTTNNNTCR